MDISKQAVYVIQNSLQEYKYATAESKLVNLDSVYGKLSPCWLSGFCLTMLTSHSKHYSFKTI